MSDVRIGRSAAAVLAGFAVVAGLSLATDQLLHLARVYPPWGEPMPDPGLNALALAYRSAYTVAGMYLTASLAISALPLARLGGALHRLRHEHVR